MIKSFVATTREIEEADIAVAEILSALNPEKNLLQNSLGIISCFSEFEDTGVLQAICDALPFECVGATSCICAADKEIDQIMFAITVLTSDDCSFKTAVLPIAEHCEQTIDKAVKELLNQSQEKPALFLSYFPLINAMSVDASADIMLTAIDKASGGIPLFGTVAVDHTMNYTLSRTIHNGNALSNAIVLAGIYGPVQFAFETASLDESKIRTQKAIITESSGNALISINGKTALEYLIEIGLSKEELESGMGVIPLVIDHKDGTKPIARAVFALTPEGHALCGGSMPANTTIGIGRIDVEDVLQTTEEILKPFMQNDSVVLSYSCLARFLVLGARNTAEAEKVVEIAGDNKYLFACSGGEICPLPDSTGKLKNLYHNYTMVLCRLS